MSLARIDSRGRVVLPKRVREALGLRRGDMVVVEVEGERIVIRKALDPAEVLEKLLGDLAFSRELRKVAEREALREVGS